MGDYAYVEFIYGNYSDFFCLKANAPAYELIDHVITQTLESVPDLFNNPVRLKRLLVTQLDGGHKIFKEYGVRCQRITKEQYLESKELECMPLTRINLKNHWLEVDNEVTLFSELIEDVEE